MVAVLLAVLIAGVFVVALVQVFGRGRVRRKSVPVPFPWQMAKPVRLEDYVPEDRLNSDDF